MRISDWSSDVCSSDLSETVCPSSTMNSRMPPCSEVTKQRASGMSSCTLGRISTAPCRMPAWCSTLRSPRLATATVRRSEEHTSELQSLMRSSYAVFCLKKKKQNTQSLAQMRTHILHYSLQT